MTPAQQAKAAGLKSLTQVSQITGVSLNTLTNWHRDKPELFRIVLAGCKARIDCDIILCVLACVGQLEKEARSGIFLSNLLGFGRYTEPGMLLWYGMKATPPIVIGGQRIFPA